MDFASALPSDYGYLARLRRERKLSDQDIERVDATLKQKPLPIERFKRVRDWLETKPLLPVEKPKTHWVKEHQMVGRIKKFNFDKQIDLSSWYIPKQSGKTSAMHQAAVNLGYLTHANPGDMFDDIAKAAKPAADQIKITADAMEKAKAALAKAMADKKIYIDPVKSVQPWSDENSDPLADIIEWKKKLVEKYNEPYDKGHMNHYGFHTPAPYKDHFEHQYHLHEYESKNYLHDSYKYMPIVLPSDFTINITGV